MVKQLLFLFFLLQFTSYADAQELNCNVIIDATQVPTLQDALVQDLKQAIVRFLNETKWTNDTYLPEEKIKCNLLISVTANPDIGSYTATAQIQASRPVYGTTYESVTLNFLDSDFGFLYTSGQQMIFNENIYNSAITSMLGFYAYIILAMDYDSFSKLGGTPYIDKARNIALTAQGQGDGWTTDNTNSRASLMTDLNNQQFSDFREGFYTYHRVALDNFLTKPADARTAIINYFTKIKAIYVIKSSSILVKTFFISKRLEIIKIFAEAPADMKNNAVNMLKELDPTYSDKYSTGILGDN